MKKQGNPADVYLTKEIMEATPQKLLLKVYDFSIQQALQKNMIKTNRGIQVLIESLNFEVADARSISIELLRLYQYCQDQHVKEILIWCTKFFTICVNPGYRCSERKD